MDLSIVVVSFNTRDLLLQCLKSVVSATTNIKCEIFIVDNNSQDGTQTALVKEFPNINLIANSANVGFAKANNQALAKASGKFVLLLNPDTKVFPDTLDKTIDFLKNKPKAAVATCRVELENGNLDQDCRRSFPTPWRSFCHFSSLDKLFPKSKIFSAYYLSFMPQTVAHEVDACVGAFMLIKKEAIKKVGLLDENFFFYGEDLDWCFRFRQAGYEIWYTPIAKILHYKGASSGIKKSSEHLTSATYESKKRVQLESTRAMTIFYNKHLKKNYPFFVNWTVLGAIKLLEVSRRLKLQR